MMFQFLPLHNINTLLLYYVSTTYHINGNCAVYNKYYECGGSQFLCLTWPVHCFDSKLLVFGT